jgi:hypothetical protein
MVPGVIIAFSFFLPRVNPAGIVERRGS